MDKLILYSSPTCPQCKMIHQLLDQHKLAYTENQDETTFKAAGVDHVPTLSVNGTLLKGRDIFNYVNGVN